MVAVRHTHKISEIHVKHILATLLNPAHRGNDIAIETLKTLVLVDLFLANPDLPPIDNPREFALFSVISEIIVSNYSFCRSSLNLEPINSAASLEESIKVIMLDISRDSLELTAWNFLFYCYVRVDLNLSLTQFADIVSAAPRSVRRYRDYAIKRLTLKIIDAEWQARAQKRRLKLVSQLPFPQTRKLLGREGHLIELNKLLQDNPTLKLLITGAVGIGKSSMIQQMLQSSIDSINFKDIVWVQNPNTVQQIYDVLHRQILNLSVAVSLGDWILLHPIVVVIDDAEHVLSEEPQKVNELLRFLGTSMVIMITSIQTVLPELTHCYQLPELDRETAYSLILDRNKAYELEPDEVEEIYKLVGGNPLGIELCEVNEVDTNVISVTNVHAFISRAFQSLNDSSRMALYSCALCPPRKIDPNTIQIFWGDVVSLDNIVILIKHHLIGRIENSNHIYLEMPNLVRYYIQVQYLNEKYDRILIDQLIRLFSQNLTQREISLALEFMCHIQSLKWINIGLSDKREWAKALLAANHMQFAHYSELAAELASDIGVEHSELEIILEYGIALRQMARWDEAKVVLQNVIHEAGRYGRFQVQTKARLEMSIISRFEGNLRESQEYLKKCLSEAARYKDQEFIDRIYMEQAQFAIEQLNGHAAIQHLQQIHFHDAFIIRRQLLTIEAYLLISEIEMARTLALNLVKHISHDRYRLGCIYNLIGRSYLQTNSWAEAHEYLIIGMDYFDEANDVIARTRCLSNLGMTYLRLKQYTEAEDCLFTAIQIQNTTRDKIGAAITQHNIEYLLKEHKIR